MFVQYTIAPTHKRKGHLCTCGKWYGWMKHYKAHKKQCKADRIMEAEAKYLAEKAREAK